MHKFKPLFLVLLSAVLLVTCTACGKTAKTEEVKTIVVGTTASHMPYAYHLNSDGVDTIAGSDITLAKKIADDANYNLEIKDFAYDDLLNQLDTGNVDFIIAAMPESKNKDVLYSSSYANDELACLVRSEDSTVFSDSASLSGQSIGLMTGTTKPELKALNLPDHVTSQTMDADDLISALQSGKINAAILPQAMADCYLEDNGDLASAFSVSAGKLCVVVRQNNTAFLDKINKVLGKLHKSDVEDWMIDSSAVAIDHLSPSHGNS